MSKHILIYDVVLSSGRTVQTKNINGLQNNSNVKKEPPFDCQVLKNF